MLGSRVVDFEAAGSFLDCHLVLVDHLDQFLAFARFNGVVASFGLGERRERKRERFRLLCSSCRLRLEIAATSS